MWRIKNCLSKQLVQSMRTPTRDHEVLTNRRTVRGKEIRKQQLTSVLQRKYNNLDHSLHDVSHSSFDIRVLALDARLDQACMTNDKTRRCSHKPEESHKRRGKPQKRNANHEEPHVEGLLGHDLTSDVHRPLVIDCRGPSSAPKRVRKREKRSHQIG